MNRPNKEAMISSSKYGSVKTLQEPLDSSLKSYNSWKRNKDHDSWVLDQRIKALERNVKDTKINNFYTESYETLPPKAVSVLIL